MLLQLTISIFVIDIPRLVTENIKAMFLLRKAYSIVVDLFETLVIAGGIFVVIYAFLFRPFQVNGESMFPTFHNNEYILTNLITLRIDKLKRGDVIVFKAPKTISNEKDFIKRVIGLPGETIRLSGGKVYVNSKLLDESAYLSSDVRTEPGDFLGENQTMTVPTNSYFVMGDNRPYSSDSRAWGFVRSDGDQIIGKSMVVYWPPQNFKYVKGEKYAF